MRRGEGLNRLDLVVFVAAVTLQLLHSSDMSGLRRFDLLSSKRPRLPDLHSIRSRSSL